MSTKKRAIIEVDERSYVSHVWFVGWSGVDLLCCLYRPDASQSDWVFVWRFRYHATDDVRFGAEDLDEKSVFEARYKDVSEDVAVARTQQWLEMTVPLSPQGPAPIETIPVRGSAEEFERALAGRPWATKKGEARG